MFMNISSLTYFMKSALMRSILSSLHFIPTDGLGAQDAPVL